MIAVFTNNIVEASQMTPKRMFKNINSIKDLKGLNFSGVIMVDGWHRCSDDVMKALEKLRIKQPDIF
tara:strand:+ start:340 stop:540 length:201 start_codon:yes stop_codon:yes gene_type:complete